MAQAGSSVFRCLANVDLKDHVIETVMFMVEWMKLITKSNRRDTDSTE